MAKEIEIENLKKKLEELKKHFANNKQDITAKRSIMKITSRIYQLGKYEKRRKKEEDVKANK